MYAIVDIETTGGNAATGAITEVAIILHNGLKEEKRFSTLINPQVPIPRYITALTGINDAMVQHAPTFSEVAPQIMELLQQRIFVAHNVNFDYSFLAYNLQMAGLQLQCRKVCTVRYARKVIPGLASYSLGNLCRSLEISNASRHRAMGDCEATVTLWEQLIRRDEGGQHLQQLTKGRSVESYMPTNLPEQAIKNLPYAPGVYYFRDKARRIVYIGKARNLSYRVRSHFSNNSTSRRKQEFLRNIYHLDYTVCATELMATVLEELEIKKHWPLYNRSQKGVQRMYGLYSLYDQRGYMRLAVEKWKKHLPALYCCHKIDEGYSRARSLLQTFELQEDLVFVTPAGAYKSLDAQTMQPVELHNQRMAKAVAHLQDMQPTMLIAQQGMDAGGTTQHVYFFIEKGAFKGMATSGEEINDETEIRQRITSYADNEMVKGLLYRFAESNPSQVIYRA